MRANWTIFTTARCEAAAQRVGQRMLRLADIESDELWVQLRDDGHSVHACVAMPCSMAWPDWVLHCLSQAQRMAHGWQLTGDIREELQAWSKEPRVSGVAAIQLQTQRNPHVDELGA